LGNALAARDLQLSLKLVRRLLDQGESAIGILLVAIVPTIRNLLLAKDLMERYRLPRPLFPVPVHLGNQPPATEATDHLPRKKDGSVNAYALGIAAQQAGRFETIQLIAGHAACLDANIQLVTTQLDHELILTEVVVNCSALTKFVAFDSLALARSSTAVMSLAPAAHSAKRWTDALQITRRLPPVSAQPDRCRECPSGRR
jgi:DNA polymerase-3 subunit delta